MRVDKRRCEVIDISIYHAQLDNVSPLILRGVGMVRVAMPGNVVTWAAGFHQTLKWILADQRFSRDWRHWRVL